MNRFTAEDGHIKRIMIECDKITIHFETWDARNLILTYGDIDAMFFQNPLDVDVGEYRVTELPDGKTNYCFYEAWDSEQIVSITAERYNIQEQ